MNLCILYLFGKLRETVCVCIGKFMHRLIASSNQQIHFNYNIHEYYDIYFHLFRAFAICINDDVNHLSSIKCSDVGVRKTNIWMFLIMSSFIIWKWEVYLNLIWDARCAMRVENIIKTRYKIEREKDRERERETLMQANVTFYICRQRFR